jgi:CRISPR-associated protein Cas5h
MDKVLVFDVWGEYAHFRKYYTTTSPLSFSIPPRTAVAGIIGGILGMGKDDYLNYFSKDLASIGVRILKPIKKVRVAENLIDSKIAPMMSRIKTRTQIRFEFLKDVKYRIYFYHKDIDIMERLKSLLEGHKSVYTPCLGLSEHIANFEFIGEVEAIKLGGSEEMDIASIIPEAQIENIEFEEGEYFSETIPIEMIPGRIVTEYSKVLFERNGGCLKVVVKEPWRLKTDENEVITFL